MLKNRIYIIIVIVQTVFTLLFLLYAFVQKSEADKQRHMRNEGIHMAEKKLSECVEMEQKYHHKLDSLQQVIQVLKKE